MSNYGVIDESLHALPRNMYTYWYACTTYLLLLLCYLYRTRVISVLRDLTRAAYRFYLKSGVLLLNFSERRRLSLCVGCGGAINDQYILKVAPDLEWHAACLKCAECHQFLDEHCTCFVRDGKTYCKLDYVR